MVIDTATAASGFASQVYAACDSMDEHRFGQYLTEDCRFVYANSDPVIGRANAAAYVKGFMSMISGIRHELLEVWQCDDDVLISRMNVTYTRKDRTTLTVPAMTVWRMRDKMIQEYLIYVDVSELFGG
ncbi:nuclear transport factor 2 family protein [Paraburkholderia sp. BL10I2N1]|uniref:nuclear transport factor 2 family protein n=1 Tax=Paraburkholderia sp. BL10I2N1 TaxID=1938796 RepID=UPI00105D7F3D|nr:nuclear transport factor 2 family protein [Paraburkholderia sp. BL10I2N1]TDN70002.1 SnoaL-like protein [Paraburkholderia sp. BL10I2N1]